MEWKGRLKAGRVGEVEAGVSEVLMKGKGK